MRFVITVILAAALLASCSNAEPGPGRTSAATPRLVGHWTSRGNDNLYFGEIDPTTKIGSYILVHPDGKLFTHRYQVESEDPSERSISTTLLFASGNRREETYVISEDGKSMQSTTLVTGIETHSQLTKVDDKTAP